MAYCSNCGSKLEENAKFCLACGTPTEQTENSTTINTAPVDEVTPAPAKASGVLNMGMLIWALINLFSFCVPLGIASLVLTILAKDAPSAEEEAKKIKTAKTCNLIGTIGGVIFIICYIVIVFIALLAGGLY